MISIAWSARPHDRSARRPLRRVVLLLVATPLAVALLAGCGKRSAEATHRSDLESTHDVATPVPAVTATPEPGAQPGGPPGATPSAVAGVAWEVPARWSSAGDRPMRVATYAIPASAGDAEGAECGVFYFGADQGGAVNDNISRWVDQFEAAGAPERSSRDVNGMQVTSVHVAGTYLAPSGPMMQSAGRKSNYKLLGAIVEGPQGSVFFKLTGPARTVDAARAEFEGLIASLAKQ
jgi:hypothetical protein